MSLQTVYAYKNVNNDIKYFTYNLTRDKSRSESIREIFVWVDKNITYKYYSNAKSLESIWISRTGDCTEKATLEQKMLSYINISSKIYRGYCDGILHNFIAYKEDNHYIVNNNAGCKKLVYIREGY